MVRLSFFLLSILSFSCINREKNSYIFPSYDSVQFAEFFSLYRDSTYIIDDMVWQKFDLSINGKLTILKGYLSVQNFRLYYRNRDGEVFSLGSFNDHLLEDSHVVKFSLRENLRNSSQYYEFETKKLKLSSLGFVFIDSAKVLKIVVHGFNSLGENEDLVMYISPTRGIIGTANSLPDSTIISYQGHIGPDTILTLSNRGKYLE